jgi:hypothetical protein
MSLNQNKLKRRKEIKIIITLFLFKLTQRILENNEITTNRKKAILNEIPQLKLKLGFLIKAE